MPTLSDALNAHGLSFLADNQPGPAEEFFREAIMRDVDHVDANVNLGVALYLQGKFREATQVLQQTYDGHPNHVDAALNYGYSLWRVGALPEARQAFERAVSLVDLPQAHSALATLCWRSGDIESAYQHARVALPHDPANTAALGNILCEFHRLRGDEQGALAICERLIAVDPGFRYNRALIMLTFGNDKSRWEAHEDYERGKRDSIVQWGQEKPSWFCKLFETKWHGQPTGHLFVSGEQGFGDIIQFLRYVPLAAERCERLTLVLPRELVRLVQQSFAHHPNIEVTTKPPLGFDHYCLLLSLGYLLDRTEDIPSAPYLVAADGYDEVGSLPGPKIGLVWSGKKEMPEQQWRSMPIEQLRPLLALPFHFVSLQVPCDVDLSRDPILQPSPPNDWADTAALVNQLDLVIGVDTAVTHLAGAMGKPVWMLNRYNTDWRWMLDRADTPWYPTMRIFRQPKMGDWDSVLAVVQQELCKL